MFFYKNNSEKLLLQKIKDIHQNNDFKHKINLGAYMGEFLDGDAFERMAREYNAKYNKINILENKRKDESLNEIKMIFKKIFHLFFAFKKFYSKEYSKIHGLTLIYLNAVKSFFKKYFNYQVNFKDDNSLNVVSERESCLMVQEIHITINEFNINYLKEKDNIDEGFNNRILNDFENLILEFDEILKFFYEAE